MEYISRLLDQITVKQPDLKLLVAFVVALIAAYLINQLLGVVIRWVMQLLTQQTDNATTDARFRHLRRVETYLSIGIAVARTVVVVFALVIAWRVTNPSTAPIALVGASTLFLVLAGATITPLLRDITYGFIMTAEKWYNVGDHIVVDPFWELSGVVEQITLRSTRLRSLTGEVIWLHNQHIQAVRVTPRAVRTVAIDTFVNDPKIGEQVIESAIKALPAGATMVTREVVISEVEQVADKLWRITASGQTVLGREWLIEDFAVKSIQEQDSLLGPKHSIVHGPIVRYVDAMAEKRFRRSVRGRSGVKPTKERRVKR